ncbi:MAG: arginine deiminase family protein, partial [Chlamydiota bacterium]
MTDGKIRAEWEPLKKVIIHRPGIEMFFGLLDPVASLYERAFSIEGAKMEHKILESVLKRDMKVEVFLLKDLILEAAAKRPEVRQALINMAAMTIQTENNPQAAKIALREFENNAKYLDNEHFFNIILLNPGIEFELNSGFRDINLSITKRFPLCNLYFMRDQQFVTDKGLVICRLAKPARKNETKLTKFLWEEVLNVPVIHEIQEPGCIEGGEFIPMGKFALVGIGSRTNQEAIDQILSIDFDFQELAVVHQPMHPLVPSKTPDPMINMHLDTYFNVASSSVVVACELLIKEARVEIYIKEG